MNYFFQLEKRGDIPIWGFAVSADDANLYSLEFLPGKPVDRAEGCESPTPVHRETQKQITAYFQGRLHRFELPVDVAGTPFQKSVWKAMCDIPYGETVTYGEIAIAVGGKSKARAVGHAANRNRIPLVIPCHRVIGSGGGLTGFAFGIETKDFLLAHERRTVGNDHS